ncbi:hypothetical protein GCM10014715_82460 [Streptomyces spiralis]|uniref:Uncharacterized protein n=1 Tax=Streptomyces spiralis TaxID=66376 RepID=A0A919AKV6_9ACTN|nr:hypothetical protein [Streptomyces spiralis]GHF14575.1 hypothetical protein GCM10014715_82460 [Streptomyces spiralis]
MARRTSAGPRRAPDALDFPYSVPCTETRAAIGAAFAALDADYTVTVTH